MQYGLRLLFSILIVLGGTGCVSYHAQPLLPAEELASLRARAPNILVEHGVAGRSVAATQPVAFDPRDGLNEVEVVAIALALNPELAAKRLEVGETQSLLITAGRWPNPEVGVTWLAAVGGAVGYSVDADALFELLKPGERKARKQVARAKIEEVESEIVAAEFQLVGEVRAQRLAVLAAEQAVSLSREALVLRERAGSLVARRREVGEGTLLEVSVAELELADGRRELRQAETQVAAERRTLNRLLGLPSGFDLRFSDLGQPLRVTLYQDVVDEELDRRLLAGRFELRAKEASYRRVEEELRLAILQQYPRVSIGPSVGRDLSGDAGVGLGVSVELPLFDHNEGEIAEKTASRDRARAQYAALLHSLRADAFGARAEVRRALDEVEVQQRDVLPLVQRSESLFEQAFRTREMSVLDWITVQQRTLRARREYLDALVRYQTNLVHLEAALGMPLSVPATRPADTQPVITDR